MKKYLFLLLASALVFILTGCADVEVAIRVDASASIPAARVAIYTNDSTVFSQLRKAAIDEYQKLSVEEQRYVQIQEQKDQTPYVIAWVWNFPDKESAERFTRQFLGSTAQLTSEQDLIILQSTLRGEEMGEALSRMGADTVRPFLGNITLSVKAYMPGEILSYVDGTVDGSQWVLDMNLGEVYRDQPTFDVEVISRKN